MTQKIITPIKRLMVYAVLCTLSCIPQITTAQSFDNFSNELQSMGIQTETFAEKQSVSRYELARLLNAVECQDCIYTPVPMIERYTNPFWSDFIQLPGKDFNDITFQGGMFQGKSYYYCVAYVGDNNYMRGYPEETSPICAGLFCGARNTNYAEFIQVVINILAKYIYQNYRANRGEIYTWMGSLPSNSYPDRYLDNTDRENIQNAVTLCPQGDCTIQDADAFKTYIKYCMFNINACNMRSFGQITEAYRPVSELNILYNQQMIDVQRARDIDIYNNIDGQTALDILYKLYTNINCSFDDDYDCDDIPNAQDNCPHDYNPSQRDTDGDGIGDVCDDDIDGDGIKNPIGIVDDTGRINVRLLPENNDNCIFVVNATQEDSNNNNIGDLCDENQTGLGMYIMVENIGEYAPLTVTVDAITRGNLIDEIQWDLGDGTRKAGGQITHTYSQPGVYVIQAHASGTQNNATAKSTIIVGQAITQHRAIQIQANRITSQNPTDISFSATTIGEVEYIQRDFGNNITTNRNPGQSITRAYDEPGIYSVTARAFKGNTLLATSRMTVGIGEGNPGSQLISQNGLRLQIQQPMTLQTQRNTSIPIKQVLWDMGDGTQISNSNTNIVHTYNTIGPRVIVQKITTTDNKQITNYITVYIHDSLYTQSFSKNFVPNTLIGSPGETIEYILTHNTDTPNSSYIQRYTPTTTQTYTDEGTILSHRYDTPGVYFPTNTQHINQCLFLESQATIVIEDQDLCIDIMRSGRANQYCDMDNDNIPDICDDDIDGDGVKNLIGLVLFDNPDCSIDGNNINQDMLQTHLEGICSLDNCPFSGNTGQDDLNRNGIGDVCEDSIGSIIQSYANQQSFLNTIKDSDGDGIPDTDDACPQIPGGYGTTTGCPIIGAELACPNYAFNQNQQTNIPPRENINIPRCPLHTRLCADNTCQEFCDDFGGEQTCNNNGICDPLESCNCPDCTGQLDRCQYGLMCGEYNDNSVCIVDPNPQEPNIPTDPSIEIPRCPLHTRLCADNTCQEFCDDFGGEQTCNNNGICDPLESCNCPDCTGQLDRCQYGLMCGEYNDNSVCIVDPNPQEPNIPINPGVNCTDPANCIQVPTILPTACNQCPCQFADFASQLRVNDRIRGLLWDQTQTTLYRYSSPYIITE